MAGACRQVAAAQGCAIKGKKRPPAWVAVIIPGASAGRGVWAVLWRKRHKIYRELAERLKKHGHDETESSIANKLSRGTFPATFMLAALVAIGCEVVKLEDI